MQCCKNKLIKIWVENMRTKIKYAYDFLYMIMYSCKTINEYKLDVVVGLISFIIVWLSGMLAY